MLFPLVMSTVAVNISVETRAVTRPQGLISTCETASVVA